MKCLKTNSAPDLKFCVVTILPKEEKFSLRGKMTLKFCPLFLGFHMFMCQETWVCEGVGSMTSFEANHDEITGYSLSPPVWSFVP